MSEGELGDPGVFALSLFGLALAMLGVQLVISEDVAGASVYAVLIAGIAESVGAMWYVVKGESYLAGVLGTFGIWLVGLYLLLAEGPPAHLFNPKGLGTYSLALMVPTFYLTIPAIRRRMVVFTLGFVALFLLELFFGLANILTSTTLGRVAGACAFAAAAAIWYTAFELTWRTGLVDTDRHRSVDPIPHSDSSGHHKPTPERRQP